MTVLAEHIGHRCEPLDHQRLRCHDCQRTLLLPTRPGTTSRTSTSPIPATGDPRCATHPTEHAGGCRSCAADRKADEHRHHTHQPTADVHARAAEARAALPTRAPEPPTRQPIDDPAAMATARAEVAARRSIPLPDAHTASTG